MGDRMARTVAVVGGGCSGVLLTRELLRGGEDDVVLIEPGEPGGGIAYGSARPWHLLNSRAGAMSADPDDPDHFVRWAGATADATVVLDNGSLVCADHVVLTPGGPAATRQQLQHPGYRADPWRPGAL